MLFFIKKDISTNNKLVSFDIEKRISFCHITITKKDTFLTFFIQFSSFLSRYMSITNKPKNFKMTYKSLIPLQASTAVLSFTAFGIRITQTMVCYSTTKSPKWGYERFRAHLILKMGRTGREGQPDA